MGSLTSENWSAEELAALTKGIAKYPPGTVNRWKVIAEYIGTKFQKQVIHKAKQIQEKMYGQDASKGKDEEEKQAQPAQDDLKNGERKPSVSDNQNGSEAPAASEQWSPDQ